MQNTKKDSIDKSYLYKMTKVKHSHRGLPLGTKERWKNYLNELEKEIEYTCKAQVADLSHIFQDPNTYDITARALDLPLSVSQPRNEYDISSDETIIDEPQKHQFGPKMSKRSLKSVDFARESSLIGLSSSMSSELSASMIDISASKLEIDYSRQDFDEFEVGGRRLSSFIKPTEEEEEEDDMHDDVYVNPPTPPPEEDMEPWIDKRSPYQKFFSMPEHKPKKWRRGYTEAKPKELLTVQEREEQLYNMIASDFCKWVSECQFKNVQLDETTITELFEVGMETPAVKAMCVQTKELPVVPAPVAQIFNMPEKSEMAGLRRQVRWDIEVAKLEEKGVLNKPRWKCGKTHTDANLKKDRYGRTTTKVPRSEETFDKWFSTNLLKKEEKSGELLWAGLEKTKVFKHFCNWLMDNNRFKKPHYLEKKGYFKNKFQIDESDMIRVVRQETEDAPIVSTVASTRNYLESLISNDKAYATILDDLVQDIPSMKPFLGFDVEAKRAKMAKDKKKKQCEWQSPIKPLAEGMQDDGKDGIVHHMALINHPEWPH